MLELEIRIPSAELYDQRTNEFIYTKEQKLVLKHSLISISEWESKWHIPFISDKPKTREQYLDYIRCMTLTQNVNPVVYYLIPAEEMQKIEKYITDDMTATFFREGKNGRKSREIVTSELIYYWMIMAGIPFECEKWHLSRLMTLIRVCGEKNKQPKKMSKRDILSRNAKLNAQRRAALRTKG